MSGADMDELEAAHAAFHSPAEVVSDNIVAIRSSASHDGHSASADTDASSVGARSHTGSQSGASNSESGKVVTCPVCVRIRGVSTCFLDTKVLVSWSQGVLCIDCNNCYRTTRAQTLTLTMLLNSFADKKELLSFQMDLVAYMTLKSEDPVKPVRASHIASRVLVIKTALSMLGLPAEPFVVMFFEDGVKAGLPTRLMGQRLLTIRTEGEDRLACAVPVDLDTHAPNFQRPSVEDTGGYHTLHNNLSVTRASDITAAEAFFESNSLRMSSVTTLAIRKPAVGLDIVMESKLGVKVNMICMGVLRMLSAISQETWCVQLKESHFTKPLNSMCAFHTEASDAGNTAAVTRSFKFLTALRKLKNFFRLYREFNKANNKDEKLHTLVPHMPAVVEFLNEQGFDLAKSFLILYLKVLFKKCVAETVGTVTPLSSALNSLLESGYLQKVWPGGVDSGVDSVSPDSLLVGVFWRAFETVLQRHDRGSKTSCEEIVNDLEQVMLCVESDLGEYTLESMTAELKSQIVFWKHAAGSTAVSAKEVRQARDAVDLPSMLRVKTALTNTLAGEYALKVVDAGISRGSADAMADLKFQTALKYVSHGRLTTIDVHEDCAHIANIQMVPDDMVDAGIESITVAAEGTSLCSPIRLDEAIDHELGDLKERLFSMVDIVDVVLTVQVYKLYNTSGFKTMGDSHVDDSSAPLNTRLMAYDPALKLMKDSMPTDEKVFHLITVLENFLHANKIEDSGSELICRVVNNSKGRKALRTILAEISSLNGMVLPGTVGDAIDDFVSKNRIGKGDESFVLRALRIDVAMEVLRRPDSWRTSPKDLGKHVSCVPRESPENEHGALTYSWDEVQEFPETFLDGLPVAEDIVRMACGVTEGLVEDIVSSLGLDGLKFDTIFDDLVEHEIIDKLICVDDFRKAASVAIRTLQPGATGDHAESGKLSLLTKLLDRQGDIVVTSTLPDAFSKLLVNMPPEMPKDILLATLQIYMQTTSVAVMLAVLRLFFFTGGPSIDILKDGSVKPDLVVAVASVSKVKEKLESAVHDMMDRAIDVDWCQPIDQLKRWVTSAGRVIDSVAKTMMQALCDYVSASAEKVNEMSLAYDHFLTEEFFIRNKAKSAIEGWSDEQCHSQATLELLRAGTRLRKLHADLEIKTALEELHPHVLKLCDSIYSKAKLTISVVKHLKVVLLVKGADQVSEAKVLFIKTYPGVPQLLRDEVASIVESGQPKKRKK